MLARCEMCFEGMRVQSKRGFEVLAFIEMCFEGMDAVEKGV